MTRSPRWRICAAGRKWRTKVESWFYPMTDSDWIGKVHSSMNHQCRKRGYAAPVDVLMDVGALPKARYEDWRFGRIPFLEAACTVNLRMLSFLLHEMRAYAQKNNLKPSYCVYKQWSVKKKNGQGKKPVIPLQFSKTGKQEIERSYATHFVDAKRTAELKVERIEAALVQKQGEETEDQHDKS